MERTEKLVQRCIEVRGVKVKIAEGARSRCLTAPPSRASVVRKDDMHVEFGGKYCTRLRIPAHMAHWTRSRTARSRSSARTSTRSSAAAALPLASWSRWPAARCRPTSSRSSSARSTTSSNGAEGIQHIGQRDITWIRISRSALREGLQPASTSARSCTPACTTMFGAIVDKVQVTLITEPEPGEGAPGRGPRGLRVPRRPPRRPDRRVGRRRSTPARSARASRPTTSA